MTAEQQLAERNRQLAELSVHLDKENNALRLMVWFLLVTLWTKDDATAAKEFV